MKLQYTMDGTFKSLKDFKEQYPEAKLLRVNGQNVFAFCGACGKPIYGAMQHIYDPEDGVFCKKCGEA